MTRVLSGIKASGEAHLGNYLGAFRTWVADQDGCDAFFFIADLHAMTEDFDPEALRRDTLELAIALLASGLDAQRCTLFVQSHVPEHPRLAWLVECTVTFGELSRMTQFKDKAGERETVRAGLFTYPALMAADVLLYDAERVPVGDDQRQHLELTRDAAIRFNNRFGTTFVVPEAAVPAHGARVMDLQAPTRKMSKSVASPLGTVLMLDPPEEIDRKVRKAVTDTDSEVRFDPEGKPGVSNLLELLAAATDGDPEKLAAGFSDYGSLKKAVSEALVEMLSPVRRRADELRNDPATVTEALAVGAAKAKSVAGATLDRAMRAAGLLAPPGGFAG
ncbi:MAG TPA: tryptophan--tRNA ligase [Acidimicrobiales bacterium]|nr:tryptophan--tRNA ligase [Acidimicrobiales bacterium]